MTDPDSLLAPDSIDLPDEAATEALGRRIAALLRIGDVVCLSGGLGAGKTTLARAVIAALAGEQEAPSPTYTLVQTYAAPDFDLWHFDLYRLADPDQVFELGYEDALETGVSLIEWPERLGGAAPPDRLDVALSVAGAGRRARLTPRGAWRLRRADA